MILSLRASLPERGAPVLHVIGLADSATPDRLDIDRHDPEALASVRDHPIAYLVLLYR
jgi:hypothetical protein